MDGYTAKVQSDFDRIALVSPARQPPLYERFLLSCLPPRPVRALEVGCGTGTFSRILATRAEHVVALDLSPAMIAAARATSSPSNVEYVVADATAWRYPDGEFDCAVSIDALHHLPLEATLGKIAGALTPGGVLLVHDLFQDAGAFDFAASAVAFLLRAGRRLRAPEVASAEVRAAWAEHSKTDHFLTLPELRRRAHSTLPGAQIKRHLQWRYSLLWRKPRA